MKSTRIALGKWSENTRLLRAKRCRQLRTVELQMQLTQFADVIPRHLRLRFDIRAQSFENLLVRNRREELKDEKMRRIVAPSLNLSECGHQRCPLAVISSLLIPPHTALRQMRACAQRLPWMKAEMSETDSRRQSIE